MAEARGPWRRHRELHPAWFVPSGLLSTLDRDQSALPMILRGVRFLVSVDRASDLGAGSQTQLLAAPSSPPPPSLLCSKQGQDLHGGQKLPRVSTLILS